MPVDDILWDVGIGADYHLVPGLVSPRLDQLLSIMFNGNLMRGDAPPPGVAVDFVSTFVPGPAGTPGATGVTFDAGTGEVTVAGGLSPQPRLLDFILVARVVDNVQTFNAYIRFHIHAGVTRMWLTPSPLTVRQGARKARFSMLAEFSDGTYGDVSNWSPWRVPGPQDRTFVHLPGANQQPLVTWGSSAIGTLDVHLRTGNLTCSSAAAAAQIQAATPIANGIATGQAAGAPPWSTPLTVVPLPGPGFLAPASAPNILIVSDGFQATERQAFLDKAGLLAKMLQTGARTSPFRELSDRINYFAAFVASRESGISSLSPVERFLVAGGPAEAIEVDVAVLADDAVGTPTNPPLPPLVGVPPTPATNTRFLLNELDTAFGARVGERPRAERFDEIRTAALSERRFDEDDFDDFLAALLDPGGGNLGQHFKQHGKDDVAVLVLCRSDHNGGANAPRAESGAIICLTLGVEEIFRINPAAGGRGQDIVTDPIPARVHVEVRTCAAHELAHSFTLGDEYGGGGPLPASFHEEIETLANVQARTPDPAPAGQPPRRGLETAGKLDADLIKWRWPRLEKAHVLSGAPVPIPATTRHRLPLSTGHPFKEDDVVRLRTRPLPTSVASDRLKVIAPVGAAEILVEPVGAPLTGSFPAGSIVMKPLRAPDPPGGLGDDLELVHVGVRNFIGSTSNRVPGRQNPLNAVDTAPPNSLCTAIGFTGDSTPARNYPSGQPAPIPPRESAWITGLFEMGRGFDCEVYHPTGACIMGVLTVAKTGSSFQFCWVCRYAMVDLVDPSLHPVMDAAYADRYPT